MSEEAIIYQETLDDIGRAIQYVEDSRDQYLPGQMAETIERMKRTIIPMTFTSNGEYDAMLDDADAYNPVTVAVPQPEGTVNINANGTVDVRQYASANVQVPQPSGTVNINQNGTTDVTQFATANVQVPNTYTAADEGKVVQSGALVAQTSRTVRENGTYDTTLNNELVVAIPAAAGTLGKLGANTTVDTLPEVYGPMGTLSDDYVTPVAYGTSNAVAINTAQAYEVKVVFRLTALPSAQAAIFGRLDASHPVPAMYVAAGGGNITFAVPEPPETPGSNVIYRTGSVFATDAPLPLGTDITASIKYEGGTSFTASVDTGSGATTKTSVDYAPYEGTGTVLLGYDQRQGNGIAGLSGATINTETTSITQGANRLWGGVKGGSSAVIQPLTVSQNGTYNPPAGVDGFGPVTVNVSGGGGNAEIKTVNVITSGNKLIEFEIPRLENDVSGLTIINPIYCYISNEDSCIYADNGEANKDQTIYAVIKSLEIGGNFQGIGSNYAGSNGNAPNIYTNSSRWNTSVWGNDTNTGIVSTVFHVLTIAIDATAKTCSYYIDGVAYGAKTIYNCGRYPSIGGGTYDGTAVVSSADMAIRYGAIVNEAHDSATVIANHQLIMQRYAGEIGT